MLLEIICGFLFLISSGLLFNEKFRENKYLVISTALIAIVSTYLLTQQLVDSAINNKIKDLLAKSKGSQSSISPPPAPDPRQPTSPVTPPSAIPSTNSTSASQKGEARAGELNDRWSKGSLYGADNEVAKLMKVTIKGDSIHGYTVFIRNQFAFTCHLQVDKNGDPSILSECLSKDEPDWTIKDKIKLNCDNIKGERVCSGRYNLHSKGYQGSDYVQTDIMKIATK